MNWMSKLLPTRPISNSALRDATSHSQTVGRHMNKVKIKITWHGKKTKNISKFNNGWLSHWDYRIDWNRKPDCFANLFLYGSRGSIWLLPIIGLFLYVGLTILNKYPFAFNYPTKVTNENVEKLYTLGTRSIRILKIIVILSFAFLTFNTINIALEKSTEIGEFYIPILLIFLSISVGILIYKMLKKWKYERPTLAKKHRGVA
jgi:hypothetical protein